MPYASLPYTGLNFLIHVLVGLILFLNGLVLRLMGRSRGNPGVQRVIPTGTGGADSLEVGGDGNGRSVH